METGNSTAGDGYKQDREHILSVYVKACKCLQVTGRIGNKYTDNRTDDHENEQIAVQIITWLKQCPYRSDTGDQDVYKNDDMPGSKTYIREYPKVCVNLQTDVR